MKSRVAVTVVGALACVFGVGLSVAHASGDAIRMRTIPNASALFDIYTPLPVLPCNGSSYSVGERVTFIWRTVSAATSYTVVIYYPGGGSLQLPVVNAPDTTTSIPTDTPNTLQWDVISTRPGPLNSAKSQRCDFAIATTI